MKVTRHRIVLDAVQGPNRTLKCSADQHNSKSRNNCITTNYNSSRHNITLNNNHNSICRWVTIRLCKWATTICRRTYYLVLATIIRQELVQHLPDDCRTNQCRVPPLPQLLPSSGRHYVTRPTDRLEWLVKRKCLTTAQSTLR